MSIAQRLNKVEKHFKCVNAEGGERFFIIEINGTIFNAFYCSTINKGKIHHENIPNIEGGTKSEYESYKQKYMSCNTHYIIDDIAELLD